jgi:pimeloyl-ACP methyl ester carboxylesterase
MSFHHGFGASSLSWLPVLRPLVDGVKAKIGLAHDAVGFGFTDRPAVSTKTPIVDSLLQYSFDVSAGIGIRLLGDQGGNEDRDTPASSSLASSSTKTQKRRVVIFGHSMGALSALRMAEKLPRDKTDVTVVLVSPAILGQVPPQLPDSTAVVAIPDQSAVKSLSIGIPRFIKNCLWLVTRYGLLTPFAYVLRRYVGWGGSWKSGLRQAWGDPSCVSPTDVLRYQWPAVSSGWENGLLNFSLSRLFGAGNYVGGDVKLFQDVARQNNVHKIIIIHGTADKVVSYKNSEKLLKSLSESCDTEKVLAKVELIPMEHIGHCANEEASEAFVNLLVSRL